MNIFRTKNSAHRSSQAPFRCCWCNQCLFDKKLLAVSETSRPRIAFAICVWKAKPFRWSTHISWHLKHPFNKWLFHRWFQIFTCLKWLFCHFHPFETGLFRVPGSNYINQKDELFRDLKWRPSGGIKVWQTSQPQLTHPNTWKGMLDPPKCSWNRRYDWMSSRNVVQPQALGVKPQRLCKGSVPSSMARV